MRRLSFVLLAMVFSSVADAQIVRSRFPVQDPLAWVSLGATFQQGWSVSDGTTGSVWYFGNAVPWHASLERTINGGTSVGIRGSTGMIPLTYQGPLGKQEADANVSQLLGTIHVSSGRGFHTVLELSAGTTLYSNFRERGTGTKIGPASPDADFTFAFGYGFGYAFSPRFSIDVVQDIATAWHQKDGLPAGDDSSTRMHGTRLVGRLGLGG
ncbi:MAG: hypothetical protein M3Z05_14970 [Gemmatimonadota bacterium]|nr:hypothetical protein [Gemmatimonadota bacterium]